MKTEKILAALFLLGISLKLLHFPGGSFASILSLGILSLVYFPFGVYFLSGKTFQEQHIGLSLGVGMALSLSIIGILFKLMHWPGALFMLFFGLIAAVPLLFVVQSLRKKNTHAELNAYYQRLVIRLSLINIVGLILFIIALSTARFNFH